MQISASTRLAALAMFSTFLWASAGAGPLLSATLSASAAARILEQATWGPTPASIAQLQSLGFDQWFTNQVNAPISTFPNQPMLNPTNPALTNFDLTPVQRQFFQYALSNPDQLRQRVAFALSEIWVVSHLEVEHAAAFPPLLNIFQKDAFANYSVLMKDVTLNPAMGEFLNMVNNNAATATSSPNENYGREMMQLFTIGLNVLNPDGTLALGSSENSLTTYPQSPTVPGMAAALTGWTYAPTATGATPPNLFLPMVPNPNTKLHDTTQKTLVFTFPPSYGNPNGTTETLIVPAGNTADIDLAFVIEYLVQNPSMAPFISQQLIQHLVTSNPSPEYVNRVADVFANNNGNLQKVVYAILTDPEARAGDSGVSDEPATFGHLREPVLLVENLLRGLNGTVSSTSTVYNYTSAMGQSLFNAPSVFSYFSPQFGLQGGLLGPEFQLYTTQTAVNRANYIYDAVYRGALDAGTTFNISPFVTAATTSTTALKTAISNTFFHGMMSSAVRQNIDLALTGLVTLTPTTEAQAALYIALTSSEYQTIH